MVEECTHICANGRKCRRIPKRPRLKPARGSGRLSPSNSLALQLDAKYFGTRCIDDFYCVCK
jgi:hypothetical protein